MHKLHNPVLSMLREFSFPVSPARDEQKFHEVSSLWWLLLPIAFFILRYLIGIFTHETTGLEAWLAGELGLVENLTVVMLVMAVIVTVRVISRYKAMCLAPKLFLIIFCAGCIYFAGEEASWGQHWFGWETNEYFLAINTQKETNLHNTSVVFDRLPKAIVSLAIFIGGVAFPIYLRRKTLKIDCRKPYWWLFPTWVCVPTSLFAISATWPSKIERLTDTVFYFDGAQEMKEFYIAYFFLLYIVSLYRRLNYFRANGIEFSTR